MQERFSIIIEGPSPLRERHLPTVLRRIEDEVRLHPTRTSNALLLYGLECRWELKPLPEVLVLTTEALITESPK